MPEVLYNKLALPDACHLGKRIFKKLFQEHGDLTATDRKAFSEDVDVILWQYTLKPTTIQIPAYEDDEHEYHEVAIIQVDLKTQKRTTRIVEVIHRAIPYPLLIVLVYPPDVTSSQNVLLSLAHKRFSKSEKDAIVVDEFFHTDWIPLDPSDGMSSVHSAFLDSLTVARLPTTNLFALYSALVDRVLTLEAARLTGSFTVQTTVDQREERRQRLSECRALETQITELRASVKQETQFNRQVEMNTQIKRLEQRLQAHATDL